MYQNLFQIFGYNCLYKFQYKAVIRIFFKHGRSQTMYNISFYSSISTLLIHQTNFLFLIISQNTYHYYIKIHITPNLQYKPSVWGGISSQNWLNGRKSIRPRVYECRHAGLPLNGSCGRLLEPGAPFRASDIDLHKHTAAVIAFACGCTELVVQRYFNHYNLATFLSTSETSSL